jgi:LPXTG-motif cell wall-anchored protein
MLKRLAGLALAASLAFLGSPAAAAEVTTADPADAAAGWLAGRLADGDHFESSFGEAWAYGLTLDSTLSFAAAGVAKTASGKALTWLSKTDRLETYAGNGTDRVVPGRYAKLIIAADANGADPAAFGGVDMTGRLLAREQSDGRFTDKTTGADSSSVFSQALVVIALERLPAGASAKAVSYLAAAQCPDGSFPFGFGGPGCDADMDTTNLALQALVAAGDTVSAGKAATWLIGKQHANGAFADAWSNIENANSTALSAIALKAAGKATEADKAAAFLKTLQAGCDKPAANRGAIAYDATGYDESSVDYATIQAIWGMSLTSLAEIDSANSTTDVPVLKCETPSPSPNAGGQLPVTGTSVWVIVAAGFFLVLAGAGTVAFGRRRA